VIVGQQEINCKIITPLVLCTYCLSFGVPDTAVGSRKATQLRVFRQYSTCLPVKMSNKFFVHVFCLVLNSLPIMYQYINS